MKLIIFVFSVLSMSFSAHAGKICSMAQVSYEAEAWLKLKHKDDVVIRSYPVGKAPWKNNIPSSYSLKYVAIPKDPRLSDCCAMMGDLVFEVDPDQTCADVPNMRESSAKHVPTDSTYNFIKLLDELQKEAP